MRVLQLIDSLNAGGAEKLAISYANVLADRYGASFLCATREEGMLKNQLANNVTYLFLKKTKTFDFAAIRRLVHFVKTHQITIIHAHASSYFFAFLVKMYYSNIKIVWHDHYGNSEALHQRKSLPITIASFGMSAVISVNHLLKEWAVKKLYVKRVMYFPNFPVKNENEVPQTKLMGIEGKRIVCLANLRPQKDHKNLIDAFAKCTEQFPQWTLHLVGKNFQDAYAEEIEAYVSYKKLEKVLYMYGSREDISHILAQCDIGVLSSKSEGLPIALLEYGLHGVSVVVTDVGECSKVVYNEQVGYIVPAQNSEALAEKLQLLMQNEEIRARIASNFTKHIEQNYSKEAIINKIHNLYTEIDKA
ncbi:glycosyltransferase [Kordia zhangzhouensis]|uniref:glycosyltransferase n=1 Tax=Kordia zhangzhouensis TaxID=1620405 RepID=UPI00062976F2|nr:glycosyltransferase [Kordia zhangzhouensis]